MIVVDCSRLPSHARETASYLGENKATRSIPLFLINVAEGDLAKTVQKASRATVVSEADLAARLQAIPSAGSSV